MAMLVLAYLPDGTDDLAHTKYHVSVPLSDPLPACFTSRWAKQDMEFIRAYWAAAHADDKATIGPMNEIVEETKRTLAEYEEAVKVALFSLASHVAYAGA